VALLRDRNAESVLLGRGPFIDPLNLAVPLRELGITVLLADEVEPARRDLVYTPKVGISGVVHLVAETGSVVVASRPDDPRSVSLLPPVHIAVASRRQLLPDLFDLFDALAIKDVDAELPSCLCLITGPSKTGDIELKLVTGVHGPGEIHVVVMDG
jgi:L-lactate utilization protein LutC